MVIINNANKTNAGEDVGEKESSYTVGEMQISTTTMESNMDGTQKTKNRTTIRSSHTTPRHISKGICSRI
jgi:hypothetical protein